MTPSEKDPFDRAYATIESAALGQATIAEAREAFMEIVDYKPRGMAYDPDQDPTEKAYSEVANSLKMALDALESNQFQLANSYTKVARIKLDKAREG